MPPPPPGYSDATAPVANIGVPLPQKEEEPRNQGAAEPQQEVAPMEVAEGNVLF